MVIIFRFIKDNKFLLKLLINKTDNKNQINTTYLHVIYNNKIQPNNTLHIDKNKVAFIDTLLVLLIVLYSKNDCYTFY